MKTKQVAKKVLSGILAVCLVIGSIIITEPQRAQAGEINLVENGGFDTTDGWYNASGDTDVAMPEQGKEQVYEAVYLLNEDFSGESYNSYIQANGASTLSTEEGALKVTGSSAGTGVRVHNMPVVAGQTYTISFDVKIDTAGMMTNYYTRSILSSNGSATEKYYSAKALTGACDWKNVTIEYTVPEGKDFVQFIIYNNNLADNYTFWIDNLSISYEQEKEELDYAMNEDFSGSELSTYIHAFQSSTIMATDGALKVTGGVGTGAGVIGVPVVAGQTYIITYKIKVDTSGLQINSFSMDGVNNSYSGQTYYSKYAFYGPCDWKTITVEYTVPDGKNQLRYDIYNNNGIADYTFWIDDFAVYNKEANKVYTYSEGIGNCLGAEPDNVLAMKEMTKASYKNISLTAGKEYGYSYKVKADGEANVTFLAGDQKVQTSAATAEWATVSGTFTADSAATEISFTREGDGILLIDDVHVYEKTAAIEETVDVNISFRAAYPQNTWVQMQINVANEEAIAALVNGAKVDLETETDGVKKTVSWCVDKNDSRTILYPYKATGKTIPVDAEQVKLYAGTYSVLEEGTDESLYVPFKLANDLTITKVNGTWYEGEPVDVTTTVSKKSFQISPSSDSAYQLILNTSNYAELEAKYKKWTWLEGDILIDGTSTLVKGYLGGETNQLVFDYHATSNTGALIPAAATSIVIPAGTKFYASNNKDPLVIENEFKLLKLGKGWAAYTNKHEYTEGGDVRYYNIANGGYMLTSSNDAIAVKELPELTTGDTITKVGAYHVSRIENEELWEETVVLYIPGDANEDGAFTVQDLVAMKWAEGGTSEKQNARLAGTYAADMDRNGEINDIDLRALRLALVSDDAAAELAVSKADSLLGGEMPITGFGTPTSAEYITDDIYKLIAGTGINMISYCGNAYNSVGKSALADKQMQLADKYGLKMYVTDDRVTSATADKPLTASAFATAVGAYSMYESFLGVHVVDEPSYGDVYINKEYTRPIANYAPSIALCNQTVNVSGYMNLLPYYSDTFSGGTSKYTDYLNNTFTSTKAEMLSYDHYAVRVSSGSWWDQLLGKDFKKTVKTEDFYKNLEVARAQVKDTGKPFWVFAQAGAISSSSTVIDSQYWPTAAEQQWEINAALAMGARGIQYWSLFQGDTWTADGSDYDRLGLIGADGKKNDRFYDAAAAQNAFVRVVDEVLMNAGSKGVVVNDNNAAGAFTSDVKLSGYNELASVTGANALVGCFDYYGKTVLYVVNCNTSASQNITLNYTATCKAAVTKFDAAALNRTPAASAASTTINVGAGQAALVIVE